MARKDRVPDPPKRPQGPQRRATARTPEEDARRRRTALLVVGAAVLAAAAVAGFLFLGGGGEDDGGRSALEDAGCTFQVATGQEGEHTAELTATSDPKWNTDPPTSGPHHPQPAIWGFYEDPVPLAQSVHNLEHGGIVVHYGKDVPEEQIEQIRAWYTDDPNALLVAPLDKLGDRIAIAAWTTDEALTADDANNGEGYLAKCPQFDEDAFDAFKDAHRYEGPERFPPEALTPGS
jgi:hypothetical protein